MALHLGTLADKSLVDVGAQSKSRRSIWRNQTETLIEAVRLRPTTRRARARRTGTLAGSDSARVLRTRLLARCDSPWPHPQPGRWILNSPKRSSLTGQITGMSPACHLAATYEPRTLSARLPPADLIFDEVGEPTLLVHLPLVPVTAPAREGPTMPDEAPEGACHGSKRRLVAGVAR